MKKILCIVAGFILILVFAFLFERSQYGVQLNEVVSCNNSVICDNTGSFHDYIELYNSTSHDIDISGYSLSDSKKNLKKFTFKKGSIIEANSYFIVWAGTEKKTIFADNNYPFTRFSVRNGEKIYLTNRDGKIIDKIKVPKDLICDMSYSRIPFTSKWGKRKPTPGKQNQIYKEADAKYISDISVEFNRPSGFYETPFNLEMSAPEGFDIYYTLDSTPPTKNSIKYTAPITISDATNEPNKHSMIKDIVPTSEIYTPPDYNVDKGTIVRAIAIRKSDGSVSDIKNASYFIRFEGRSFYRKSPIISIITDPEDLFNYENGIYVSGKIWDMYNSINPDSFNFFEVPRTYSNFSARGKHFTRKTHIDYIKDDHTISMSGKIKIQGNWSRRFAQKNFAFIDMQKEGSNDSVPDFNLRAIHLGSRITELIIYFLTEDRNLIPIKTELVNVFLDGEYWGLYAVYDRINPDFIARSTNLTNPDLIDLQYNAKSFGDTTIEDIEDKTFDELKEIFDLDNLIDYIVINIYTANKDVCDLLDGNNVVRWKSRETPEMNKWHWILFDQDNRLLEEGQDYFNGESCSLMKNNKLLEKLLSNPDFKKQFIITFQDVANYNFNPRKVTDLSDWFRKQYNRPIIQTQKRFYGGASELWVYIGFLLKGKKFFNLRFDHAIAQMKDYFSLQGNLMEVHKIPSEIEGGIVLLNTLKIPALEQYDARYLSDYNISLDAQTFDGYHFEGWRINDKFIAKQKLDLDLKQPQNIQAVWTKKEAHK